MRKSLLQNFKIGFLAIAVTFIAMSSNSFAEVGSFVKPKAGDVLKVNRPYLPEVNFTNIVAGANATSTFHMVVTDANGVEVYNEVAMLEGVPKEGYSTMAVKFPALEIRTKGSFKSTTWMQTPAGGQNNAKSVNFETELGLSGVYTVGTLNERSSFNSAGIEGDRNYADVKELMDGLHIDGISGDVEFRFTDPEYDITAPNPVAPAWDFSSKIIGVGPTNDPNDADGIYTITLRPANNRIAVRGGVKFNMTARSGYGVLFGHNIQPSNINAVVISFPERQYARSAGYITFDGGSQKSFEFELNTTNTLFGSALYLQRGSSNITIKNSLVTNNSPQIKNSISIPAAKFDENNGFNYDRDIFRNALAQDVSYSSGITSRATLIDSTTFIGDLRDTLPNFNNKFQRNDITGFAIGVIDIGIGVVRHNYSGGLFLDTLKAYYNNNNLIEDNRITDASRTGVFLGYTEDNTVKRNLIWDVNAPAGAQATGIEAGGVVSSNAKGMHNVRLSILGNRITKLTSNVAVTGIRVEQDRTIYESNEDPTKFPRDVERTRIANNFIWGLNITSSTGNRAGIHLLTQRKSAAQIITPDVITYTSRRDDIVNNTIIIGRTGFANFGMTVGIGVQNTTYTNVVNNAISIVDNNITTSTPMAASILVQGNTGNDFINVDRNVYWSGYTPANLDNTNIDLLRYVEQDKSRKIVSEGYNLEYATLNQIQAATNTQNNSIYGDFLKDLELYQRSGFEPLLYRVKTEPTPLNSILNNRGQKIDWLTTDFEGDVRGAAGQRYDIGADEFFGRLYVFDLAPVTILSPRSYRSTVNAFSDAEHIMTEAPVNVRVNVRNNGSIQQSGTKIYVKIYLADTNDVFGTVPVLEKEVVTNIPATDNNEVDFGLGDGGSDDWIPQTYADLINADTVGGLNPRRAYSRHIPAKFAEMVANVTPRYRIDILVGSDLENANNIYSKNVRFYLKKTPRHVMVSSVSTSANPLTAPTAQTAGKLNYEKINEGFETIGFKVSPYNFDATYTPNSLALDKVYDYDVFDRGSWEPRAVDYKMYNFLFYSDGYNVAPTRFEKLDLYSYLDAGSDRLKNSLVFSVEEWTRLNAASGDEEFNNRILRANYVNNNPLGNGNSYEGNTIIGQEISKDYIIPIELASYKIGANTFYYPNDVAPRPAVMTLRNYGSDSKPLYGVTGAGYLYNLPAPRNGQIFGTTTISLTTNIINNGVDWRHFGDIETIMRGTIDHLERNDASIVPVELTEFNAGQSKKSVVLDWATSSENGTAKFIVERADAIGDRVTGNFTNTGLEVPAVGKSTQMNYYGPVVDENVQYGNTYAYRLRTVDFDGTSDDNHPIRIVEVKPEGNFNFTGFTMNPASTSTQLTFTTNSNTLKLDVVDLNGKVIYSENISNKKNVELNVSNFANGTYTVVLTSETGIQTKQLNVIR